MKVEKDVCLSKKSNIVWASSLTYILRGALNTLDFLTSLTDHDNYRDALAESVKVREEDKSDGKVDWPIFSDNFLAITGVGLLILTIVNNILFRVFFGPPIPHSKKPHSAPTKQFRLRSNSEPSNLEAPPLVD